MIIEFLSAVASPLHSSKYFNEIVNNELSFLKDLPGEEELYRTNTEKDDFVPPSSFNTNEYIESNGTESRSGFENVERKPGLFTYYWVETPDNQTNFNITVPNIQLFQNFIPNLSNFSVNTIHTEYLDGGNAATINFTIPSIGINVEDILKQLLPKNLQNVPIDQPNEVKIVEDLNLNPSNENRFPEENIIIVQDGENTDKTEEPNMVLLQEDKTVTETTEDETSTAVENRILSLDEDDSGEFTTVPSINRIIIRSSISPKLKAIIHRHKWLLGWKFD